MARLIPIPLSLLAALPLCLATLPTHAQISDSGPGNRVQGRIVESRAVTLLNNTHPLARPDFDRGVVAMDVRLDRMMLILKPSDAQQRDLDALSEAQQDPASSLFHQWLSPQQYGQRFGISEGDLARIADWLAGHGFRIDEIPAGRRLILFSGSAAEVTDTFHVALHRYEVNGQPHLANAEDPQIPEALAPVVAGIVSLHDFRRVSATHALQPLNTPANTQGSVHYLMPADFATIYNLTPLDKAALTGTGVSIAIVGRSNISLSDIQSFRSSASLPANTPRVILTGLDPKLVPGDQDEATLDVEWSGGIAPGATIQYVAARSTATSDGVDLAAQYIVNNKTAPVMSTSFGSCESRMGAAELAFYNSLWQQAAVEGISAFVSSGDSGASGCDSGSSSRGSGLGVNGLCSSPYSTCVGGTQFNEGSAAGTYWGAKNGSGGGSALSYIPEKVWNESASAVGQGLWSSGGGISAAYPQPAWQKGVSGAAANGMRAVPDVSLTSAGHDGYLVCLNGSWYAFAGTSASSPSFAGILARILQSQGGKGQGNVNPIFYGLLSAASNPFHPTPSGNNTVPGVSGYTASGAAYNLATGLGSVDANTLRTVWPSATVAQGFTLKTSLSSISLLPGKSATFTVSAVATGGFTGSIALTTHPTAGVSLTFSPASIKPGITATTTLSLSSAAAPGSFSEVLNGSSGSLQAAASIGLVVLAPPTLTLSTPSSKVILVQGKAAALAVTVKTGGSFAGPITLSMPSLPSGVTASWSSNGFSLTGTASQVSTLTLTAAPTAALVATTLLVKAMGDGLQAQSQFPLQIVAAPAIQLALSPSQLIMKSTGTLQCFATITLIGGVSPAASLSGVTLQSAGLPPGVTAAWSRPVLTSSGQLQAMATLSGGKSAATSKTNLNVTARVVDGRSGTAYSASQSIGLSVTKATQMHL